MHIVSLITSALVLLLASSTLSLLLVPRRDGGLAPLLRPGGSKANLGLPDKYIVKLGDRNPVSASEDLVSSLGIKTDTVYNMTGFKGFSGTLKADILDTLRRRPEVEYVEQDAEVKASAYVSQENATWGLARISHRSRGHTSYVYDSSAGAGTCTYIVDTGIYAEHVEFEGRASNVFDSTHDDEDGDGNGHGTHVAGIAGSRTYGVAKGTRLFGVKVLDSTGSGTTSGVIRGLNFVATQKTNNNAACPAGTVANLSLGGAYSAALNNAAAALVGYGVFVAVASGGDDDDAVRYSPASESTVCTVSASDENDTVAASSNWGALVDVYAPGKDVLSTWNTGPIATDTLSGTSMATAYVSGLGAYLLALEGPRDGVTLCQRIRDLSTKNVLTPVPVGTGNYLVSNGNPSG